MTLSSLLQNWLLQPLIDLIERNNTRVITRINTMSQTLETDLTALEGNTVAINTAVSALTAALNPAPAP